MKAFSRCLCGLPESLSSYILLRNSRTTSRSRIANKVTKTKFRSNLIRNKNCPCITYSTCNHCRRSLPDPPRYLNGENNHRKQQQRTSFRFKRAAFDRCEFALEIRTINLQTDSTPWKMSPLSGTAISGI